LAWSIHGQERCIFHTEKDVRKEISERPLSRDQQILIISRQIKSLQKSKDSPLEKAREIRSLVLLLKELQEDKSPYNENKPEKNEFEKHLEEWNKKKSQA